MLKRLFLAFSWQNCGWKVSVDLRWKVFFMLWSQFVRTGIRSASNPPVLLRPYLEVRKVQSEQQQTRLHIYFLTLCFLTTRVGYVWARRLSLSVICWVDMSLCWGKRNVICSQRFLIWAHNERSFLCFHTYQLQLTSWYLSHTVPYLYPTPTLIVAIEQIC